MVLLKTIKYLNDRNFEREVKATDSLVLVAFVVDWNSTGHLFDIIIEKLPKEIKQQLTIYKVDCSKNRQIINTYKIGEAPTILVFKNGTLINRFSGFISKNELVLKLDDHIKTSLQIE